MEDIISPAVLHRPLTKSRTRRSLLLSVPALEELELLFNVTERDGGSASDSLVGADVVANLGSVSLVSVPLHSSTANCGASADDTSVDAAGDAVVHLDVDLGHNEELLLVGGVLPDVSPGGGVDHLAHLEAADSLVLGHATRAIHAPDHVRVSLVLLSSSVVSSL